MHICLTCRGLATENASGLVRATCDLAEALADAGHQVELLTDLGAGSAPALGGVSVRRLPVIPLAEPPAGTAPDSALDNLIHAAAMYREVRRIHERERPIDAVMAPLWRSLGALCALDERFPTIVSCMTSLSTLVALDHRWAELPDIGERLRLEDEALRRARYLHGLTGSGLDKTITEHSLHPAAAAVVSRGLRDRWSGAETPRHSGTEILYVGRIEERKGLDTLLLAARELVRTRREVSFTIVGPDAGADVLKGFRTAAAADPRLREAVSFRGIVSDEQLWRHYERADIVCLPSRYESHGIAVVEAMMFGKPVVTSGRGGLSEVVIPEQTALIADADDGVAVADQLRRLIDDQALRRQLGAAGRRLYEERFESHIAAAGMASFVERVIAEEAQSTHSSRQVQPELETLLSRVLAIDRPAAAGLATELLEPESAGMLRRLRDLALATPPGPTQDESPQVTAVVLTRDRPELLRGALDSLSQTAIRPEVIVIDDASAPEAGRRVAAECAARPGVQLHRSERHRGCAAGRRLGVELAAGELILFLDDDAELLPGALEHLCAELAVHPESDAVTATVVLSDGQIAHSGGSVEVSDGVASYALIGADSAISDGELPPTGEVGWVPGTAVLIRRAVLEEFPIDDRMIGYYEDNEWSYRVRAERPGDFRRSREALALHHLVPKRFDPIDRDAAARWASWLASHARFYERHGVLLAPWLFDLVPELRAEDGSCDYPAARLLLELALIKGSDWVAQARLDGELDDFLSARRIRIELAELRRLVDAVGTEPETLARLERRDRTLAAIEQGGWWRLRGRIQPALALASRLRDLIR